MIDPAKVDRAPKQLRVANSGRILRATGGKEKGKEKERKKERKKKKKRNQPTNSTRGPQHDRIPNDQKV